MHRWNSWSWLTYSCSWCKFILCNENKIFIIITFLLKIPPQEVLTRDSVTVKVDAVIYYHVFNPVKGVINITDLKKSTKLLVAATLRKILGMKTLQELLTDRERISSDIQVKTLWLK